MNDLGTILRGIRASRYYADFVFDPIRCMATAYGKYGPLVAVGSPFPFSTQGRLTVLAVGPSYNQRVLEDTKTFRTAGLTLRGPRCSAQRRLRMGIVRMNGASHRHYRRQIIPLLRKTNVDRMAAAIAEIATAEVERWPIGQTVDIVPLAESIMRHIAIRLLFGETNIAEAMHVADMVDTHLKLNGEAKVLGCPLNIPGLPYRRLLRHAERTELAILSWAQTKRGLPVDHDLLSIVVNGPDETGQPASKALIAGHVPTLFGASFETATAVLTWTLFLLAQHPQVALNLLEELNQGRAMPSPDQLDSLPLLDAVLKESMRVLPPVPYQTRATTGPTRLASFELPTGSRVFLSPYLTNRMSDVYEQPDRFLPERWRRIDPSPYEYLTFSAGPRHCPGYWFAMKMLKISIAAILAHCRFTVPPNVRIDRRISVTMSPRCGLPMEIRRPDREFKASPVRGNIGELVAMH